MTFPVPSGVNVYSPKIRDQAVSRKFVSQYGPGYLALGVVNYGAQEPIDPDADSITLKVWYNSTVEEFPSEDPRGTEVISVDDHTGNDKILKEDIGKFYYNIGPEHTSERGVLTADWKYTINGESYQFTDYLQILEQMPVYDRLTPENKVVVEQASWFFADLFDSTTGGPWLQENFQSHYDFERMSQLLGHAVTKMNVLGWPITNYGVFVNEAAIPANMTGLTVWSLKLETIRHLMRSYTEQPNYPGTTITWTDRRDYVQRWKEVLDEEKPEFERAVKMQKRGMLSLARGALLVSGGIWGGSANSIFMNGMGIYAAQARSFRFYPASFAVLGTGNNISR